MFKDIQLKPVPQKPSPEQNVNIDSTRSTSNPSHQRKVVKHVRSDVQRHSTLTCPTKHTSLARYKSMFKTHHCRSVLQKPSRQQHANQCFQSLYYILLEKTQCITRENTVSHLVVAPQRSRKRRFETACLTCCLTSFRTLLDGFPALETQHSRHQVRQFRGPATT